MTTEIATGQTCYIGSHIDIRGTIEEIITVRGQVEPLYLVSYWCNGQLTTDRFHRDDLYILDLAADFPIEPPPAPAVVTDIKADPTDHDKIVAAVGNPAPETAPFVESSEQQF